MGAEARLKELNITLPEQAKPVANYVAAVRVGNLLFVSGHGPYNDGKIKMAGKLGRDLTVPLLWGTPIALAFGLGGREWAAGVIKKLTEK